MFDSTTNIFGIYSGDKEAVSAIASYTEEYYGFKKVSIIEPVVEIINKVFDGLPCNNNNVTFDPANYDTEFYLLRLIEAHGVLAGKSPPEDFLQQLVNVMYEKLPMPVFINRVVSLFALMVRVTNNSALTSAALASILNFQKQGQSRFLITDIETSTESIFVESLDGIIVKVVDEHTAKRSGHSITYGETLRDAYRELIDGDKNFINIDINASIILVDTGDRETLLAGVDMMMSVFGDAPVKEIPTRDYSAVPIVEDENNMLMMHEAALFSEGEDDDLLMDGEFGIDVDDTLLDCCLNEGHHSHYLM